MAAATVRGLILTVSHKEQMGELYPQVLEALVYGACRELFEYAERPQKCGFSKTRRLVVSNYKAAHTD